MKTINNIPRRNQVNLNEIAELAITHAMQEVEKLPPDVRLTKAIILLQDAKDLVADFIDDIKYEDTEDVDFSSDVRNW